MREIDIKLTDEVAKVLNASDRIIAVNREGESQYIEVVSGRDMSRITYRIVARQYDEVIKINRMITSNEIERKYKLKVGAENVWLYEEEANRAEVYIGSDIDVLEFYCECEPHMSPKSEKNCRTDRYPIENVYECDGCEHYFEKKTGMKFQFMVVVTKKEKVRELKELLEKSKL